MKSIDKIPTSKIQRAGKLVSTGAKVGVNYLKYYGEKITKSEAVAKENLNKNNAEDIYSGLKQLKGSALKVAQMLSMEKSILPQAYVDKFSLAQFSVPPLSPPLVIKTFKKYFGQHPNEIFDEFDLARLQNRVCHWRLRPKIHQENVRQPYPVERPLLNSLLKSPNVKILLK